MPRKHHTLISTTCDTKALEDALTSACGGNLQITHRLELRLLATPLWYDAEMKKQGVTKQNHLEPLRTLTNFKANLKRRKTQNDTIISERLMDLPDPARTILLSDVASIFHNEIDDYTQIDFGNDRHVELLKVAVDKSIAKTTNKQGRPVNETLDKFFIGLRDLYEEASGKKAIAEAHYSNEPKAVFCAICSLALWWRYNQFTLKRVAISSLKGLRSMPNRPKPFYASSIFSICALVAVQEATE